MCVCVGVNVLCDEKWDVLALIYSDGIGGGQGWGLFRQWKVFEVTFFVSAA